MQHPLTLAQTLCLVSVRQYKGRFLASRFRFISAAALITDLYLLGAVDISGRIIKRVKLVDKPSHPSEGLARAYDLLAKSKKDTSLRAAIHTLSRDKMCFRGAADELVANGHMTAETYKILRVFKATRYVAISDDLIGSITSDVSAELSRADGDVSPRLGSVIMLLREGHLLKGLVPRTVYKSGRRRARLIALGKLYRDEDTRKTLAGIRGAMTIIASNAAGGDGGGDGGD